MNINRHNYEEFFLLYIDNELSAEQRKLVEEFLQSNPDLNIELDMLSSTLLADDAETVRFPDKNSLFRTASKDDLVTLSNHETFFVQYADNELSNEEKAATEQFVYSHPELQAEFEFIQQVKLEADHSVVFPDKNRLYRKEESTVRPMFPVWTRYAAAAMVLLVAGFLWMQSENNQPTNGTSLPIAGNKPEVETTLPETSKAIQPEQNLSATKPTGELAQNKPANSLPVKPIEQQLAKTATNTNTAITPAASIPETRDLTATPTLAKLETTIDAAQPTTLDEMQPGIEKTTIIPVKPNDQPTVVFALNEQQGEDILFIPGKDAVRKTPLRGLLRKASRFIDKNNPLSEDRSKGGVFTASHD